MGKLFFLYLELFRGLVYESGNHGVLQLNRKVGLGDVLELDDVLCNLGIE